MNFYLLLSVFVVVSIGPWATAEDVFLHFRKTSIKKGPAEETKKKLSGDAGLPLINSLVQVASKARTWTQWLRRLLKALRKWCHSHPPEVKLAKCLTSYFNIKLPGIRRFEKLTDYNDESKVSKVHNVRRETATGRKYASQQTILTANALWNNFRGFLRQIKNRFLLYVRAIYKYEFAMCAWEYILKKFWMWVDSAPDSRFWL